MVVGWLGWGWGGCTRLDDRQFCQYREVSKGAVHGGGCLENVGLEAVGELYWVN